jgi:signal transduction histidine kinase
MFRTARFKLTAWYLFIIMCVSSAFSLAIYKIAAFEINRFEERQRERIERQLEKGILYPFDNFPPPHFIVPDPSLLEETKNRIAATLVVVNGIIFVLAGALGYLLAGRTLRPIAQMLEDQKRFISDASHELKTPLTSLKLAFEVFQKEKKPSKSEITGLVEDSLLEINRLDRLVQSLLSATRHQDRIKYQAEKIDLSEVIQQVIKTVSPIAKSKEIAIEVSSKKELISGNREALIELVTILIDNAVKYSPPKNTVRVSVVKRQNHPEIIVADQGMGIAKKDLPHIFDRFYRGDEARLNHDNGSYGLGLSIAKQIARDHNATISVKSSQGKGTIFTVKFS